MLGSPYWNPKTETLSRAELDSLRLAKLRVLCRHAMSSAHYRRAFAQAGFEPDQLRGLGDLRRIPLLTRAEWMHGQEVNPPFGDLPVTTPEAAIRVHTTSGTSGSTPLRALDTRQDWAWVAEMWAYGLWGAGVRAHDTAYIAFGYGSFIGFWGLHDAAQRIGALVVPGGAQTTGSRLRQILDFGATVVASTPTYALRLAEEAVALGIDLPASPVRRLILSGEPAGSIPETRALIERAWGAAVHDTAGMTEVGTITTFECAHHPGGMHIIEDQVIEEVLDPLTLEPVPYGVVGERVVTSFGRAGIPLLRYRTADLVERVPHDVCGCGRGFDVYRGGILGRADDMKLIRGTNVYPRAVEQIVRQFPDITEFQVRFERTGIRDEVVVRVESPTGVPADLGRRLSEAHEGLKFRVEQAEPDTLPRFELKARRFVDTRTAPLGATR
ncbi:phenylacetate-CoA ligase [Amycolatopsis xylanica]|uniref:Phenylacetate-CoA ligase n=1 Tax=Amycolatopsis xylanica TaxID=589385 RepID=A0A1H2UE23_9PSEU|nr:AMP-binding protein [Amycolatopsis xylanica]SDW54443.1 phenylacetate-CoA ligase [Amycolatopsis xylanica]